MCIIPAHAGQTAVRVALGAFPRASSPRMRGKPRASTTIRRHRAHHPRACGANLQGADVDVGAFRIIPAHAGQTYKNPILNHTAFASSPRMRGKPPRHDMSRRTAASSPRMRGKPCSVLTIMAGSAHHPRACGANRLVGRAFGFECASSPRMRGKPSPARPWSATRAHHPRACGANRARSRGRWPSLRIIPAHAGQTSVYTKAEADGRASSPRMRGKPV